MRLGLVAGFAAIPLLIAGPPDMMAGSEECVGPGDPLCSETVACVGLPWAEICTTTYVYYPDDKGGGK
jgi:hypothetical protein